ncbi:MAG: serine/threonine-protein kinase [Roseiarcus sp.]|uniref:serine/threonine-protein kinase n=1 Tax=Roseiarcus sp. TaxID=1969460 RepID=UPI003C51B360
MIPTGSKIGNRYVVESLIGQGGMQDVYKAKDLLLDRYVALKTPQAGQKIRRFRDSAVISARINHHNVAKTYDLLDDEFTPFLIEEFVEGETLDEAIIGKARYLDPFLASTIFLNLAKGTAASHNVGVIHRDLKPSNVLVSGGFNLTNVKITDFGIATLTEAVIEEVRATTDLTRSSSKTIQGALPYMAPEMMFRKVGEYPDQKLDVWSIGAMMFRLLTDQYAFGEGFEAVANVKMGARTPWPSFMTTNPQFSVYAEALQRLVETCLQQNPDLRPSAQELAISCEDLVSFAGERYTGIIDRHLTISTGIIRAGTGEQVFFHRDSIYGTKTIIPGTKVSFCASPGSPFRRAHPITVIN